MKRACLVFASLALMACQSEQTWSFSNGVGLPVGPPPRIVAEVFDAEECGFACRPEGERRYCHELIGGAPGPSPDGLDEGARYCFMGTAINEEGEAFAIGCAVVDAGGDDVLITLSALEENRVIARQCDSERPVVRIDAGPIDASVNDAGRMDSGPGDAGTPTDAGTAFDAGTRSPATLPSGAAIVVFVQNEGPGSVFVSTTDGRPLGPQPLRDVVLEIETMVGLGIVLRAQADSASVFRGWNGSDCGTQNPCSFVMDRNETVRAVFE